MILALFLGIALGIVAVALLVNFIMTILIWNPLEVGCKKLFIQCEYGTAETRCIWSVIKEERYNRRNKPKPWQVPQIWAWNHIYHGAGARNGGTGRNSD